MTEQLDASPSTAAELCLFLIMCLPDEADRALRIKDFCRLYEIAERRPALSADIGQPDGSLLTKLKGRMGGEI